MEVNVKQAEGEARSAAHPFRTAVLRGLGIVTPPLLTIVIFVWVGSTVQDYLLEPVSAGARNALVWYFKKDALTDVPLAAPDQHTAMVDGKPYYRLGDDTFIPMEVYERVRRNPGPEPPAPTVTAYYTRYVEIRFMQPYFIIPFFLCVFILLLYLLGKFIAAGVGRVFYNLFEQGIRRLPLIRNVYSSVKQVSDFLFSEREVEYTRVVAVEYPRKGIWSLGFVTGESLVDISAAANEPVLSVLMATSPMPMTGFTVTVKKSEVIDLNITVDQALQFIISCGVVVPPSQIASLEQQAGPQIAKSLLAGGASANEAEPGETTGTGA